jgi:glycerophosphoryl diester phosphodiesterase
MNHPFRSSIKRGAGRGTALMLALAALACMLAPASAQVRDSAPSTLSGSRALVIAHRGGAKESTENTIGAFERAIKIGADGIETDLRLTRDGVVIIYHDDRFGRVEGLPAAQRSRFVADMTYAELSQQALIPVGEDTGGRRVPTLNDLLADVRSGLLNIELKRVPQFDELVNKTIALLKDFRRLDRVVLEAPDLKTAEKLRSTLGPRLRLQINPGNDSTVPYEVAVDRVLKFKPHSLSVSYKKLSWEVVELAHKAGVEVWVYTVDSPEIARAMTSLGADAIKSDSPTLLLQSLRR